MNVDLHALYYTNSIAKARSAFSRGVVNSNGVNNGNGKGKETLSKSPSNNNSNVGSGMNLSSISAEINRRDSSSRTVLHLAASDALNQSSLEWLGLLLSIGSCSVNLADLESGWTALHRALYAGNIAGARMLLARDDILTDLKDREGPFKIFYNTLTFSTLELTH